MGNVLEIWARGPLCGQIRPPSDKSLTHRAYIFAAMAAGGVSSEIFVDGPGAGQALRVPPFSESQVMNPLKGEDCESTLRCLIQLGQRGQVISNVETTLEGGAAWRTPDAPLDCGNSGTTMRLLAGLLAGLPGVNSTLVGDPSLSRRPMGRIVEPLRLMGAQIEGTSAPLSVAGTPLHAISYQSPVASAQIKSCLLIAGLAAAGTTWVTEPSQSRDHTERMFRALGVNLLQKDELTVGLEGGQNWPGFRFHVPADISSAAFMMVAAACLSGSALTLLEVGINPTRTGILDVLEQVGIPWVASNHKDELGEPVADLTVRAQDGLAPFEICGSLVPRLIDEIPVLAVLATQCKGTSSIRDAKELRVKESDRICKMAEGLTAMGAKVEVFEDGLSIEGPTQLIGTQIEAEGDHRIAMAFAIAGLLASGKTVIRGAESIATSYPNFVNDIERLLQS